MLHGARTLRPPGTHLSLIFCMQGLHCSHAAMHGHASPRNTCAPTATCACCFDALTAKIAGQHSLWPAAWACHESNPQRWGWTPESPFSVAAASRASALQALRPAAPLQQRSRCLHGCWRCRMHPLAAIAALLLPHSPQNRPPLSTNACSCQAWRGSDPVAPAPAEQQPARRLTA